MRIATRIASSAVAALLIAGVVTAVPATPAQARPALVIPPCAGMLPSATFTRLPGLGAARPYTPPASLALFGAVSPTLQATIRANPNRTCSWSSGPANKTFTISEVDVDAADVAALRSWYRSKGHLPKFYGGNAEWYTLPVTGKPTWIQLHVLDPDGAWITVTDRFFGSGGAITQNAVDRIYRINPWLE